MRPPTFLLAFSVGVLACKGSDRSERVAAGRRAGSNSPGLGNQYVGLVYERAPAELREATGVLLDALDGTEYSLALMAGRDGDRLWLNRKVGQVGGVPRWKVIAEMPVAALASGEQLVIGMCRRNGQRDSELSAVVITEDVEWYRQVRRAWRADRRAGRFEEVPAAGVECENEGYGAG